VKILIYGDAFWPTYTTGDNTGLVATDSMKNFVQRETMNFPGYSSRRFCPATGALDRSRPNNRRRQTRTKKIRVSLSTDLGQNELGSLPESRVG
jgi:hypothetical protein